MDEDVKLSMVQAHQKWMVRAAFLAVCTVLGTVAFCAHDCEHAQASKPCSDAYLYGDAYELKCPDARQALTWERGDKYARCSCPKAESK